VLTQGRSHEGKHLHCNGRKIKKMSKPRSPEGHARRGGTSARKGVPLGPLEGGGGTPAKTSERWNKRGD